MLQRHAFGAVVASLVLIGSACTSSTSTASHPDSSGTPTGAASTEPTPSPSPTPTGPLTITSVPVHNGEVGVAFAPITLTATGGIQPYSWAVGAGALPVGLSLSAQGVISGQVGKDGAFKFNVSVADSGGSQASKATAITIFKHLVLGANCSQLCVIGQGCAKCGTFGTAAGGQTPYTYKIVGGAVPKGMSLAALSLKGGFPAGSYTLSVQVTDAMGVSGTVPANWSIYSPAVLVGGTGCVNSANPPQCRTTGWTYTGGNPSVAPKIAIVGYSPYTDPLNGQTFTENSPPPGWTISVKGGTVTLSAGGIACNAVPSRWASYITVVLVDPAACATTSSSNKATFLVDISNNC